MSAMWLLPLWSIKIGYWGRYDEAAGIALVYQVISLRKECRAHQAVTRATKRPNFQYLHLN